MWSKVSGLSLDDLLGTAFRKAGTIETPEYERDRVYLRCSWMSNFGMAASTWRAFAVARGVLQLCA